MLDGLSFLERERAEYASITDKKGQWMMSKIVAFVFFCVLVVTCSGSRTKIFAKRSHSHRRRAA
jgi:hypothetical protein